MAKKEKDITTEQEKVLSKKEIDQIRKKALTEVKDEVKDEIVKIVIEDIKKDLSNVIKDVKEDINIEYKSELKETVKNELIDDIKNQIKKEEAKLSRKKSWKIFRLNVYLVVLIAFCGFLIYQLYIHDDIDFLNKVKKEEVTTTTTTNDIKEEKHDLSWYINEYGYLMNNIQISNLELLKGSFDMNSIDASNKLSMSYNLLSNEDIIRDGIIYKISKEKIDNAYKKIFAVSDQIPVDNFLVNNINFAYSSSTNDYIAISGEEIKNNKVINNIVDIREDNNKVIITTSVCVKIGEYIYNINNLEVPVEDNNALSKVSYTFEKINDKYYLTYISSML